MTAASDTRPLAPVPTFPFFMFDLVHLGVDEFGEHVYVNLAERNMLIGGEPGGGKSSAEQLIVAHGALSHDCRLVLVDGNQVQLGAWRHSADMFIGPSLKDAIEAFTEHLDAFTLPEADALVFTSPHGMPLRHANFRRDVWYPALAATGLDVHLHDLRHIGNQLTADAGANLRELMERMGHSSSRAALIYLHSTSDRQSQLAETVALRVQAELSKPDDPEANRVARMWHDSESTDGETP